MIWGLHGAVGMAEDYWEDFCGVRGIRGVDLWDFLRKGEISLEEAGARVAKMAEDGDTLVGYSMGARIALHALEGRNWERVILISGHPGLENEDEKRQRRANDQNWAQRVMEGSWEGFLEQWNGQAILPPVKWGDRKLLEGRREEIARSFRCWSLGRQQRKEVPGDVEWLVGEWDLKFRRLAPAGAVVVPGCGHRVPWEAAGRWWPEACSQAPR